MIRAFIDPSVQSMGVAVWTTKRWRLKKSPSFTRLIRSAGENWIMKSFNQIRQLETELLLSSPDIVYIEMPQFFETGRGMTAQRSGSIQKLAAFVGMLINHFGEKKIRLITPSTWKGQLPKDVVIKRIKKRWSNGGYPTFKADVWDAVGMGMWKMGLL